MSGNNKDRVFRSFQDKEEKERLMVSKAPLEESDKEVNSGGEEIIELQEMRVSPIPSLRNRHKQKYYKDPRGELGTRFDE